MNYTAATAISAGALVVMTAMVGVAIEAIASGSVGVLLLDGVFNLTHSVTTTSGASQGDFAYALSSGGNITGSATSSRAIGAFIADVAQADTTAAVKLGAPVPA